MAAGIAFSEGIQKIELLAAASGWIWSRCLALRRPGAIARIYELEFAFLLLMGLTAFSDYYQIVDTNLLVDRVEDINPGHFK